MWTDVATGSELRIITDMISLSVHETPVRGVRKQPTRCVRTRFYSRHVSELSSVSDWENR